VLSLPNVFLKPARTSDNFYSGVESGGATASPKVLVCQKFGQNLWKSG